MTTKIIEYAKNKKICGSGNSEVSGTINIEANGIYGVAKYATANVNVPDTSGMAIEVSELPTPTAEDVGKVYLNTTNGEHYLGEEQAQDFVIGEPLGDKIYFDTTKNPMDYISNFQDGGLYLLYGSNGVEDIQLAFADLGASGSTNVHLYFLMFNNRNTGETTIAYVYSDDISLEDFNTLIAPDLGLTISQYGWQKNVIDTSPYSNFEITQNNLSLVGNLAYKSKTIAFKPLDKPPVLQEKAVTENGVVMADAGYDGLSKVTVDVADKGTATLNALIAGTLTEIESGVESVGDYAFYENSKIATASFPNATNIGEKSFYNCKRLTTLVFPNVTSIKRYAFYNCSSLESVDFPNITNIEYATFSGCSNLESANIPNATDIAGFAFYNNLKLKKAYFPYVTTIGQSTFAQCIRMEDIYVPNVTSLGESAFQGLSEPITIDLPSVITLSKTAVSNCDKLENLYLPNITEIAAYGLTGNWRLIKVIIGVNQSTVATLAGTTSFNYCYHILGTTNNTYNPTGAKDGYIYVPLALVADYRVATNWATYATQIMPYVSTVDELTNIDGTTYDKACVGTDYIEYTYNGTAWEVYER